MSTLMPFAVTAALLGAAVIAGTFFAFSSFVMKALARIPSAEAIAAMQSINIVVINPSFLGVFMGTALLSLGIGALAILGASHQAGILLLSGSFAYFVGTFLVTMLCNVPLNNQLAASDASDPTSEALWAHYLGRWTMWNHVRTAAAIVATLLYSLALLNYGGT